MQASQNISENLIVFQSLTLAAGFGMFFRFRGPGGEAPWPAQGHEVTHNRLQIFEILGASYVSVLFPLFRGHRILVFGNIVTGHPTVTSDGFLLTLGTPLRRH